MVVELMLKIFVFGFDICHLFLLVDCLINTRSRTGGALINRPFIHKEMRDLVISIEIDSNILTNLQFQWEHKVTQQGTWIERPDNTHVVLGSMPRPTFTKFSIYPGRQIATRFIWKDSSNELIHQWDRASYFIGRICIKLPLKLFNGVECIAHLS